MKGKVSWFNEGKGYGFITGEDGKDYFIHFTEIKKEGFKTLKKEEIVTFTASMGDKGEIAKECTVIE